MAATGQSWGSQGIYIASSASFWHLHFADCSDLAVSRRSWALNEAVRSNNAGQPLVLLPDDMDSSSCATLANV